MAYFHCTGGVDVSEDTVTSATLLSGYTAHDKDGNAVSGSMTNNGAVAPSKLNCGGSYTIPAGYHNGSGKVEANTLASQLTGDTVAAAYLLSGYKAHTSAGTAITGSMTNRGATNAGLSINGSYTIPAGYHNGSGKVTQSISVKAATTHYAATSAKTAVAAGYYCSGNQNIAAISASNLAAGNIKSGVTISVSNGSANLYSVKGTLVVPKTAPKMNFYVNGSSNNRTWAYFVYTLNSNYTNMNITVNSVWDGRFYIEEVQYVAGTYNISLSNKTTLTIKTQVYSPSGASSNFTINSFT